MFFLIAGCFCLFSIILIVSPFWLAQNKKIQTSALKKGLEHVKMLKEETLNFWIYDEKRYKGKLLTDLDWQRRKMELKNQYIALSRQEIIYKDAMDSSIV
jgi:hypothetical protein